MKKKLLLIDAFAFTGFLLAFYPDLTGYTLHEWLGLAVGLTLSIHFAQHWHWIVRMCKNIRRLAGKNRDNFIIDVVLAFSTSVMMGSGLTISSILNLSLSNYSIWRTTHVLSSIMTIFFLSIKMVNHRNLLRAAISRSKTRLSTQEVLTPEQLSRRDFLWDSAYALVAVALVAGGIKNIVKNVLPTSVNANSGTDFPVNVLPQVTYTTPTSISPSDPFVIASEPVTATSTQAATTIPQTGKVLCGHACSFPGRCRKYVDNNQNKRCDRGEPIW